MDAAHARLPGIVIPGVVAAWPAIVEGHLSATRSENTRSAYTRDLADWTAWCGAESIDPLTAQRANVQAYVAHLRGLGRAPSTISRRLSAIRGAYGWAVAEAVLDRNPAAYVRGPTVDGDSQALGLARAELGRFLAAARAAGTLEYAFSMLLAFNALRVSTACSCDVADLVSIRGMRALRVTTKGGKRPTKALNPDVAEAIDAYLAGRRTGPLFRTAEGRRLDRHRAYRMIGRLAKSAGLPPGVTPHSLRHTFVTLAREAGVPLEDVQDAADHADPRTTRNYDRARHQLERSPTFRFSDWMKEDPPD